jgi:hypothetical protein
VQCECPIENQEKCTTQSAPIVDKNVKSPSNQTQADLYIAENVGQKEDHQEEVDIKLTS